MSRVKVLLADDHPDILKIYSLFLGDYYDVLVARDGLEAWRLFEQERPRVVVTDLNMPGINGLELTQRIKSTPEFADTVVIIITGTTTGSDLPPGFWNIGAQANKLMEKPVSSEALVTEIRRQLLLRAHVHPLPPGTGDYRPKS